MAQISMNQTQKLEGVIELLSLQQQQLNNIDKQLEQLSKLINENSNSIRMIEGDLEEVKGGKTW
jgi:prefoldin subunit 5